MKEKNKISCFLDKNPKKSDDQVLSESIADFNAKHIGEKPKHFSVFLKDDNGKVRGGISLYRHSDAIYVDILWVEEAYRKLGFGKKLLTMAEEVARQVFDAIQKNQFYILTHYKEHKALIKNRMDNLLNRQNPIKFIADK